jgi:hypothetical protein
MYDSALYTQSESKYTIKDNFMTVIKYTDV